MENKQKRSWVAYNKNMRCLILSGPPGSGKTTIGKEISLRWGWVFLEKDNLFPLPEKFLRSGTQNKEYREAVRPLVYKRLAERAAKELCRSHVVVEAPLLHEISNGENEASFVRFFPKGSQHLLVWITCSEEEQYLRRQKRGARQDRHLREESWEEYRAKTRYLFRTPPDILSLDSSRQTPEELLEKLAFFRF